MALTTEKKSEIVESYRKDENDTGSSEVQIALITERIKQITDHLRLYRKDHAARRGLIMLVGQRKKLLRYLRGQDYDKYKSIVSSLSIRTKD